ncbi:MAG: hypothetical protein Kow00121_03040 [Elainellaceae cyanobacterium]
MAQTQAYLHHLWRSLLISGVLLASPLPVMAQRIPIADVTLGNERSIVSPDEVIRGVRSNRINGGARRGANLFHSFREFNIDEGRGAYFTNPDGVANILARVTGGSRSDILGTLGVLGDANLFLINPNGILFGSGASLDLNGSFISSTAESIVFDNEFAFSATNPQAPPLLTVNVPIGLQYGVNSGEIRSQGASLQVQNGQALTLVGGTVNVDGGELLAPGGQVEVGSVSAGTVGLNRDGSLSIPERTVRADILLTNGASANVGGVGVGNAGNIMISGGSIFLTNASLTASNTGRGNAGRIAINASNHVSISDGSLISSDIGSASGVEAVGNVGEIQIEGETVSLSNGSTIQAGFYSGSGGEEGGLISIRATDSVEIDAAGLFANSEFETVGDSSDIEISGRAISLTNALLTASNIGQGNAGRILIRASNNIAISNDTLILSNIGSTSGVAAVGDVGEIEIESESVFLNSGSEVQAGFYSGSRGEGGLISIRAADSIEIDNAYLFADLDAGAAGNGSDVEISGESISLNNDSLITSDNAGKGDGGNVSINAPQGSVVVDNSAVNTSISGLGNGGSIEVITGSLVVRNGGQLSARNDGGQGNAGSITINAQDTVTIAGFPGNGDGTIVSDVRNGGIGNANNLNITARSIDITDEAIVAASIINGRGEDGTLAQSGDVNLSATERVSIRNNSVVFSEVGSNSVGNGGTIHISAPIVSLEGASVNTQIRRGGQGKAGDINIFETELFRVTDGGQLAAATSGAGNAGNINITSEQVIFEGLGNNLWALNGTYGDEIPDSSGAFTTVRSTAVGNAGGISITTGSLEVTNGAEVSAATFGRGNAGNITFDASTLIISGGAQVLAATTSTGNGGSIVVNAPVSVDVRGVDNLSPVLSVETSGAGRSGSITITTPSLTLAEQARITATATATATNSEGGGSITINAANLDLAGTVGVFAETQSASPAGTLTLQPDNDRSTLDIDLSGGARISASTSSSGRGGNLFILAPAAIIIQGNGRLSAETIGTGRAGDITIRTPRLTIANGAIVSASTFSLGEGGDLSVNAPTAVLLRNRGRLLTESQGSSRAGTLNVTTDALNIRDGAAIAVSNTGRGDAGNLTIQARGVSLNQGSITGETAVGERGNIRLRELDSLQLTNGSEISASTGRGEGGNLRINTREGGEIVLDGNSRLAAEATNGGRAGNLEINNVDALTVADRSRITVSSTQGEAGNVEINADAVTLDNGTLEAIAGAGNDGNITLNASGRLLQLSNGSRISAEALSGASGGNVTLNVADGFVVANPLGNSDILASAVEQGDGGRIDITTQSIFGLAERNPVSAFSDINASSEFGLDGTIELNTALNIDPTQGLAALPENVAPPDQIDQRCATGSGRAAGAQGEFVVTGRGGLPPNADEALDSDAVRVDLVMAEEEETTSDRAVSLPEGNASNGAIVEAQGWVVGADGNVALTASTSADIPYRSQQSLIQCLPQ